ncbi:MAG TPA: hypothetical protein VJL29_10595 [Thermoguttaceae bacterium]|nr:hypothetical protein [Thermoguttaceae bacterium]
MSRFLFLRTLTPYGLLLVLTGCGTPEPLATVERLNTAQNELADTLETVHDAQTAREAVPRTEATFRVVNDILASLPGLDQKYGKVRTTKKTLERLKREQEEAAARVKSQLDRVYAIQGLPIEFWKVTRVAAVEYHKHGAAAMIATVPTTRETLQNLHEYLNGVSEMLQVNGHERTVLIDFENLPPSLQQSAFDKLKPAVPNLRLVELRAGNILSAEIAPVDDYQTLVQSLDFGRIKFEDAGQRRIVIEIDRRKLGARANSDEEEHRLAGADFRREQEARQKVREEARRHVEVERAKAKAERQGPQPDDPDYFEKMAERMMSDDPFVRNKAIEAMAEADPSRVTSPETRKMIARHFRSLLFESHFIDQEKCIKGLVLWAGKYSVPVLLELLETDKISIGNRAVFFRTLGDLKDPRAARPVAKELKDPNSQEGALECLRRLGPAAEDAILEAFPTLAPWDHIKIVQLLGDCGTNKSLRLLREGQRSRNLALRMASKQAAAAIRKRRDEARKTQ